MPVEHLSGPFQRAWVTCQLDQLLAQGLAQPLAPVFDALPHKSLRMQVSLLMI